MMKERTDSEVFRFPAGKYYIGDPCYVVESHEEWMALLETSKYFDSVVGGKDYWHGDHRGAKMFASGTAYGDGEYHDNDGGRYGVDAGLLGIIPADQIDGDGGGGRMVEFKEPFDVWVSEEYTFHFGHLQIPTAEEDEDEDEYCDYCGNYHDECSCEDSDEGGWE